MTTPTFLRFRGALALSDFRSARLLRELQALRPSVKGLAAEFWHFVEA